MARTTAPVSKPSAISSAQRRRSVAATAGLRSCRRPGWWRRRFGIARRAPGDPQLHTHVLVANLGRGPDGRWSALDGRRLYAHARAASFVYQAVLRAELTRTLGLEWLPVRNGIADLVGVPKPVLRAFSRRRAEIQAALAERGTSGPRAAEAAALATRQTKQSELTIDELVADWRARAVELGLDHESVERLLGRVHAPALDDAEWQRTFAELAAPTGLTRRASTFSRRDVFQALCERLPAGALVDARAIEAATDRFLASPHVVALLPAHGRGRGVSTQRRSAAADRTRCARLLDPGAARARAAAHPPGRCVTKHRRWCDRRVRVCELRSCRGRRSLLSSG